MILLPGIQKFWNPAFSIMAHLPLRMRNDRKDSRTGIKSHFVCDHVSAQSPKF